VRGSRPLSHIPAALANPLVPCVAAGPSSARRVPTAPPNVRLPHCPLTSSAGADSLPPLPRPPHRPPPRLASNSAGVPPGYRGQPPAYSLSSPLPLLSPATPSTSTWVALEPCPMQQSMCWSCQSHERHPRDPCAAPPPRSAEREVTSESSFYGCRSMQRRRKQQLHL